MQPSQHGKHPACAKTERFVPHRSFSRELWRTELVQCRGRHGRLRTIERSFQRQFKREGAAAAPGRARAIAVPARAGRSPARPSSCPGYSAVCCRCCAECSHSPRWSNAWSSHNTPAASTATSKPGSTASCQRWDTRRRYIVEGAAKPCPQGRDVPTPPRASLSVHGLYVRLQRRLGGAAARFRSSGERSSSAVSAPDIDTRAQKIRKVTL